LLESLKQLISRLRRPRTEKAAPTVLAVAGPGGIGDPGHHPGTLRDQLLHYRGRVFSCVRPIAQRIAAQPIRCGRKSGRADAGRRAKQFAPAFVRSMAAGLKLYDDHPLLAALETPNPYSTKFEFLYAVVVHLQLTGISYLFVEENEDAEAGFYLWSLPGSWVTVNDSPDDRTLFESYTVRPYNTGAEFQVAGQDMVRLALPDPINPVRGVLGPLQGGAQSIDADESILAAQAIMFHRGIFPGFAITVGRHPDAAGVPGQRPVLTKDQKQQIITAIKQMYAGVGKFGEPLILDSLIEKVEKISNTPAEMDFSESSLVTRDRVDEIFGVNAIVQGRVQDANRASAAVADELFVANAINPLAELISQQLTRWARTRFDDRVVCYVEPCVPADPDGKRANLDQLAKYGCLRKNELRAERGLPPLSEDEGGDELIAVAPSSVNLVSPDGGNAAFGRNGFRHVG
jgi:HK97 family phage portal protein